MSNMSFEFRTIVDPGKFDVSIDPGIKSLLVGSCFSDNIGSKFLKARLQVKVNPFGVIYNPVSTAKNLERARNCLYCKSDELVSRNGLWHHFDFHGRFSNPEKDVVCRNINKSIKETADFLSIADFLIITFGTSFVYERNDTSDIVSNCHKFPSEYFSRYRLESDEIVALYKELIVSLRMFNPNLKIIFTVSPVRHWKDGAHGNQVSKSVLLLAIDKLCDLFSKVWYFPAYEIVIDELRDYRFYDSRMFNPSAQAVEYIWKRFVDVLLSDRAKDFIKRTARIENARNHKLMGLPDENYRNFILKTLEMIQNIETDFPEAVLLEDKHYFESLLDKHWGNS
jgi:hypothetical protein